MSHPAKFTRADHSDTIVHSENWTHVSKAADIDNGVTNIYFVSGDHISVLEDLPEVLKKLFHP